jgi:CMP-N-acetylneuraminic acid synthetase
MKINNFNILVLIPARGGSKGIPNKNIIDVGGQPLIKYSIDIALALKESNLVNTVLVSTDYQNIADLSVQLGAEVPFLRPPELSLDNSKTIDAILHALDWFEINQNKSFDAVLLLQPTSPLRSVDDLKKAIQDFYSTHAESLISVYKEEYINDLVMYKRTTDNPNFGRPLNELHNKGVRRQDHGSVFVRNGSIYLSLVSLLKKGLIISDNPLLFEMSKSSSINLDTPEDLILLRNTLCK